MVGAWLNPLSPTRRGASDDLKLARPSLEREADAYFFRALALTKAALKVREEPTPARRL